MGSLLHTTVRLILNPQGWTIEGLADLKAFDEPQPVHVVGEDQLQNGNYRVAALTFATVEDATQFRATANYAMYEDVQEE